MLAGAVGGEPPVAIDGLLQLGLDQQAGDEGGQGVLEGLAHEAGHQEVALHLDVLAQVQAGQRGADAQLGGLDGLVGQVAAQRPLLLDVEAHGRVDVGLQARGQVVEAGLERDLALGHAGQVGDLVGDLVPLAVVLLGRRLGGRLDHMALVVGGVEIDHLEVVVQRGQDGLAGDAGREGGDGGEDGAHHRETGWWWWGAVIAEVSQRHRRGTAESRGGRSDPFWSMVEA